MPDVVIVGGGITGAAAADALAREGCAVTLIEQRSVAAMASGRTLGGVRQSGRHPAELPLARAAVAMWAELTDSLGADVEYRQGGNLRLARSPAEVDVIRTLVDSQRALGLDLHLLADNTAVRSVAPAISPLVLAASYCPSDGHANPVKTTRAFVESARRYGAAIREGVAATAIRVTRNRIAGVETSGGFVPAECVVVAAGVHTPSLLAPLRLDLPLSVQIVSVGQSVPLAPCLDQVLGVANADCAGRQEADGRLRFTSGIRRWPAEAELRADNTLAPSVEERRRLVDLVAQILPVVGTARIERTWGGLIDLTPDALPVIDAPDSVEGLVVAAGFSGHGFCLGPICGPLIADLAQRRAARHDLSSFRLSRFDGTATPTALLTLEG